MRLSAGKPTVCSLQARSSCWPAAAASRAPGPARPDGATRLFAPLRLAPWRRAYAKKAGPTMPVPEHLFAGGRRATLPQAQAQAQAPGAQDGQPPLSAEQAAAQERTAVAWKETLGRQLRAAQEQGTRAGSRELAALFRAVVSYPHWVVPGTLHRNLDINTLFTFARSDADRGLLPIFTTHKEFEKFYQLLTHGRTATEGVPPRHFFEMSGSIFFSQIAQAADRTNLQRIVLDITSPPSFSIAKGKLDSWKVWAEIVCMEIILQQYSDALLAKTATEKQTERAIAAALQFPHFLAVRSLQQDKRLLRVSLSPGPGPGPASPGTASGAPAGAYLVLFTGPDLVAPRFLDAAKYAVQTLPGRAAFEVCQQGALRGLIVNPSDDPAQRPLAVISLGREGQGQGQEGARRAMGHSPDSQAQVQPQD